VRGAVPRPQRLETLLQSRENYGWHGIASLPEHHGITIGPFALMAGVRSPGVTRTAKVSPHGHEIVGQGGGVKKGSGGLFC